MTASDLINQSEVFGEQTQVPAERSRSGRKKYDRTAENLGWFSIGLGLTEIFAPRLLSKMIGIPPRTGVMRLMGLREVAVGAGILSSRNRSGWLWARVAGDALDIAALAKAGGSASANGGLVTIALGAVGAVTMLDVVCAKGATSRDSASARLSASTITNRPPDECYRFWRQIERFPTFQEYVKSVQVIDDRRSHWVASGPAGVEIEWNAEITEDVPGEQIAWRTVEAADVPHSGSVRFEELPAGRGTIIRLRLQPLGAATLMGRFLGRDPGLALRKALLRCKQLLETGEIATTEGQPSGRQSDHTTLDRMARI